MLGLHVLSNQNPAMPRRSQRLECRSGPDQSSFGNNINSKMVTAMPQADDYDSITRVSRVRGHCRLTLFENLTD